jgi:hypothetical protein
VSQLHGICFVFLQEISEAQLLVDTGHIFGCIGHSEMAKMLLGSQTWLQHLQFVQVISGSLMKGRDIYGKERM